VQLTWGHKLQDFAITRIGYIWLQINNRFHTKMERKTTLTSQTQAVHLGYPSFTTCTVSGIGKPRPRLMCDCCTDIIRPTLSRRPIAETVTVAKLKYINSARLTYKTHKQKYFINQSLLSTAEWAISLNKNRIKTINNVIDVLRHNKIWDR